MSDKHDLLRLSRHDFLLGAAALAGAALLPACGQSEDDDLLGAVVPDGEPLEETQAAVHTPSCEETEDNIEGPFYRPGAPLRTAIAESWEGIPLVISGRVMGLDRQCSSLPGALVDVWQANASGTYDRTSSRFRWRGRMRADNEGRYRFETIIPGRYLNGDVYRPRHIHLKVSAPGWSLLTTQLYFRGDRYLANDPFMHPKLVIPLYGSEALVRGTFNIVLARA